MATLVMNVQEEETLADGYQLKLNSYDLGVDVELAKAYEYLRFTHPEVRCVVLTGALDRVFCAGANIHMLSLVHATASRSTSASSPTRRGSGHRGRLAATRGLKTLPGGAQRGRASRRRLRAGHGLRRDRAGGRRERAPSRLPELPLLGVLPGTGGLTRLVDKRKIRRDLNGRLLHRRRGRQGQARGAVGPGRLASRRSAASRTRRSPRRARAGRLGLRGARRTGGVTARLRSPPESTDEGRTYPGTSPSSCERRPRHAQATLTVTLPDAAGPHDRRGGPRGRRRLVAPAPRSASWTTRSCDLRLAYRSRHRPLLRCERRRRRGRPVVALDALLDEAGQHHWFVNEVRQPREARTSSASTRHARRASTR